MGNIGIAFFSDVRQIRFGDARNSRSHIINSFTLAINIGHSNGAILIYCIRNGLNMAFYLFCKIGDNSFPLIRKVIQARIGQSKRIKVENVLRPSSQIGFAVYGNTASFFCCNGRMFCCFRSDGIQFTAIDGISASFTNAASSYIGNRPQTISRTNANGSNRICSIHIIGGIRVRNRNQRSLDYRIGRRMATERNRIRLRNYSIVTNGNSVFSFCLTLGT